MSLNARCFGTSAKETFPANNRHRTCAVQHNSILTSYCIEDCSTDRWDSF